MGRVRAERRLRTKDIATLAPGIHEDGGGLRLVVEPGGSRHWVQRLTVAGKRHSRGLGSYPVVTLEDARDQGLDLRRVVRNGSLPQPTKVVTFRQAFTAHFEVRRQSLTPKHIRQWLTTMETYVFPHIGDTPVGAVTHSHVLEVLKDLWFEKPETARRVLQRMDAAFKAAILRGWRKGASPTLGVSQELGTRRPDVEHLRALPYRELPTFIRSLRACGAEPLTKLALEFLVLTATRGVETRGARWEEINETAALWTIPGPRMKLRKEHTVPLSARCVAILGEAKVFGAGSPLIFPSARSGKALSEMVFVGVLRKNGWADRATPHGFRSSFRDWCSETGEREVVAEAALAHVVRGVEGAYRRSTLIQERRGLMQRWSNHCEPA